MILTWMMRTMIWTTLHCIDIFDKNTHFGVWGGIGPLGTEHKILSNPIKIIDKFFEIKNSDLNDQL